ncbi:serine/threonine-protein phosphatase 7 long form homolog [Castanea sativa]|uniref:serine/threonine-protein phosphatase 7 long form homolog n=1 Tax=Castanea sativa TaxID=21020 RepID=UPI003F64CFFB
MSVALDRVQPGLDDHTQLTRQPNHRSTPLWRHASDEAGLDPRIMQYIDAAGLTGLFKVREMEVDHALIMALVEWWHPETHTFHLPHGEMGITLQDIEVMLGVLVDGVPITGKTDLKWNLVCRDLLGDEPPVIPNTNRSTLAGARLKYTWLDERFTASPIADAGDKVVQQYACYHLLIRMGALLFMDKSADRVSVLALQFLNPINNVRQYSWGSVALAWLYRHLCSASKKDVM